MEFKFQRQFQKVRRGQHDGGEESEDGDMSVERNNSLPQARLYPIRLPSFSSNTAFSYISASISSLRSNSYPSFCFLLHPHSTFTVNARWEPAAALPSWLTVPTPPPYLYPALTMRGFSSPLCPPRLFPKMPNTIVYRQYGSPGIVIMYIGTCI
jgi:hypothetical protein